MPDPAIQIENLSAAYGAVTALRSANLTIQRGEIFGLLGPNGAGKTTLLSCLEGLHAPKEGAVRIAGETPARAKARLGIQLQKTALLDDLTVVELIELYAGLYNVFLTRAQIEALLAALVIAVGVFGYGVQMPLTHMLLALPMMPVSVLMSIALGQVVSGIAPGAGGAVAVGQILYFGQMFITDLIMPIEQMPTWVQTVGPWLPGYAIAQLVRPPLQAGALSPDFTANLVLALAYGLASALIAARLFKWERSIW